jgi:fibro-slime domain-containing protein
VSVCADGYWQACKVQKTSERCETACGEGLSTCEDGRWGSCEVPEKSRLCQNDCGWGEEICRDGAWGTCEVPRFALLCQSVCGGGEEVCEKGVWRACNAPQPKPPKLRATIRDFSSDHPDFEQPLAGDQSESGIVAEELGPDDKPVYRGGSMRTTSGQASFDQWYRDVEGVNASSPIALDLAKSDVDAALFVYDDREFFPIDGLLLGNESRSHNFHFTLEASTSFQYIGGEVFRFQGDDDMWVFINRRLAIDLGGIHASKSATVDLDQRAGELGLTQGDTYALHFFFAERHTNQSNFTIETSIAEPGSCD